ncbi:hypothetical protein, partial [Klebsiella pneumoniae]|uniref:hypothetical protein n=1 Tax=Klebsiella pneumoniae TaxID=573 RepID=UPI0040557C56
LRIRCKISEQPHRPWSKIAEECTEEYNRTTHSVTKYSPLYLLTGNQSIITPTSLNTPTDLEADRKEAFQNSRTHHLLNKTRKDQKKKQHNFKVGDLVYVETGNRLNRKKLDPLRSGPFKVEKRVSSTMYQINFGKPASSSSCRHFSFQLVEYWPDITYNRI